MFWMSNKENSFPTYTLISMPAIWDLSQEKKNLLHANSARNSAVVISPLLVALLKDIKTKFATCSMSSQ